MAIINKPKILTLNNISQFFDLRSTGISSLKAGMLVQFRYNSPEGVHDAKPLVFILEKRNDRIWGLNFHYQFNLMTSLIQLKDAEVQKFLQNNNEYRKYQKELTQPTKEELADDELPDVDEVEQNMKDKAQKIVKDEPQKPFDVKKIRFPQNMLEDFTNGKITVPKELLRNYLFTRMNSLQKLSYKVT